MFKRTIIVRYNLIYSQFYSYNMFIYIYFNDFTTSGKKSNISKGLTLNNCFSKRVIDDDCFIDMLKYLF